LARFDARAHLAHRDALDETRAAHVDLGAASFLRLDHGRHHELTLSGQRARFTCPHVDGLHSIETQLDV
jgi:hypothetical protein